MMDRNQEAHEGGMLGESLVSQVPGVPARLPEEFGHLDVLIEATYRSLPAVQDSQSRVEWLRLRFFDRAFNIVKGVKTLLEQSHWELAAPLVRQLFELVVNLEEVHRGEDPDDVVNQYQRYALLQEMRHQIATLRYDISAGRGTKDAEDRLSAGEAILLDAFPDFRVKRRGGDRWAESWCGATIRQLSKRSDHPHRKGQYDVLFSFLSAYTHVAPIAVLGTLDVQLNAQEVTRHVDFDDKNTIEVIAMTLTYFSELWMLCGPPLPSPPSEILASITQLGARMGAHDPSRPESARSDE